MFLGIYGIALYKWVDELPQDHKGYRPKRARNIRKGVGPHFSHPGRWREGRSMEPEKKLTPEESDRLNKLMALPYLQGYRPAPKEKNVTLYEKEKAFNGLNLVVSGHAPESYIMDMNGNILHKWHYDIDDIWPDKKKIETSAYWRRVYWFENGDILAMHVDMGIVKLNKDSELLWHFKGRPHHDLIVTENGEIYTLTRMAKIVPRINRKEGILDDHITILNSKGELLDDFSILGTFENSPFKFLLKDMRKKGDVFHTNTIRVFDGTLAHLSPLFKKGNILISILRIDVIAVVDPIEKTVIWAASGSQNGMWYRQHEPILLENGHFLLFDNKGHKGYSKIIEFDPLTMRTFWEYKGDPKESFYSETCGTVHRLPNGNTLIIESDNGRVFEVTPEKEIVWEYRNPHRAGKKKELIATLLDVKRVRPEFANWLDRNEKGTTPSVAD